MVRAATEQITAGDFFAMADEAGVAELVRGEVTRLTPAGGEHGVVAARLLARLLTYVESEGLGYVFAAETGFVLATDPDTVRAPDLAFLSHQRLGGRVIPRAFVPLAPDLAVEVVSPSESAEAVQEKLRDYFAAGTRLVWVLFPALGSAHAYSSPIEVQILEGEDRLSGGEVVPGFSCRLVELFG